jgi:head-tail adaptor
MSPLTASGVRRQRVDLANPGARVPDPSGGFTYEWVPCTPAQTMAAIAPATTRGLTQLIAGTTVTTATHLVTVPYHPQVKPSTRLTYTTHEPHALIVIAAPVNTDNLDVELTLVCSEVVSPAAVPGLVDTLLAPAPPQVM